MKSLEFTNKYFQNWLLNTFFLFEETNWCSSMFFVFCCVVFKCKNKFEMLLMNLCFFCLLMTIFENNMQLIIGNLYVKQKWSICCNTKLMHFIIVVFVFKVYCKYVIFQYEYRYMYIVFLYKITMFNNTYTVYFVWINNNFTLQSI